jgi:YidC/Oxa1 family membrane protein insertase
MLLAFALMILIWVVFSRYIMPHPERPPETPDSAQVAVSDLPAEAETESPQRREMDFEQERVDRFAEPPAREDWGAEREPAWRLDNTLAAEERDVVVEGELYRAVLSTRGGLLRSWALKNYTDAAGEPADLVDDYEVGALGLLLEGPEGLLDLTRTIFAVEESSVAAVTDQQADAGQADAASAPRDVRVIRFVAEGNGLHIERIYRIDPTRYDMEMELLISGVSNYRQDHNLIVAWEDGMPFLEEQRKTEQREKGAQALLADELVKVDFGGGRMGCGCGGGEASRGGERAYEGVLRWAGVRTKYFAALLIPEREEQATFITCADPEGGRVGMRLVLPLDDEGATRQRFTVYAGPTDYRIVKELNDRLDRDLTRIVNFGSKFIAPISKASHWFLVKVYSVIPNYGVAILILSLFIRLLFHPLTVKSLRSQRRLQMLKPELDALNEEYKDKPEVRAKKTMELHKKHGVSPLGGCLPLLVQMPVIYALYGVLMNAIELRKAPFVWWMKDLAAPDKVGELFGIPIHILPILMAVTMFAQQKMTPTDPRQAPMLLLMPVFMVFIFYSLPSGLVLYWTVVNILTMAQQLAMKPEMPVKAEAPAEEPNAKRKAKTSKRK